MKPSLGLRGLFILFSLTWTCAGDWSEHVRFPGLKYLKWVEYKQCGVSWAVTGPQNSECDMLEGNLIKDSIVLGIILHKSIVSERKNSDQLAVKVRCSYFWFYAKIKPTLFQNLYMNPDEAFLGDDCPVTYISPDAHYEFFYYSNKCGIIIKTFQETLLLQTKVKYISSNSGDTAEMPLSCVVTKQASMYRLSDETESRDDETSSADMEVAYIMQSQNDLNTIFSLCAK